MTRGRAPADGLPVKLVSGKPKFHMAGFMSAKVVDTAGVTGSIDAFMGFQDVDLDGASSDSHQIEIIMIFIAARRVGKMHLANQPHDLGQGAYSHDQG